MSEQTLFDSAGAVKEEWRPVVGFEGRYEVSNLGRIRSWVRPGGLPRTEPLILKLRIDFWGYPVFSPGNGKKQRPKKVHHAVAEAFLGPRPPGMEINHKNGIKVDATAGNLEYITQRENMQHAQRTGLWRAPSGEKHPRSKFTEEQVREMRRRVAGGEPVKAVAAEFNTPPRHVRRIVARERWAHVG